MMCYLSCFIVNSFFYQDDNIINLKIHQRIVTALGCSCDTAENGKIAVDKARTEAFDIILMVSIINKPVCGAKSC